MFIKLCILKSDIKSVAFGTAEKHSVNTAERASPWRWPRPKACRGNGQKLDTGPKITRRGKVKLEANKPFPSSLFNISRKHPNHKSVSAEVKRQVFLPFGKLFRLSSYEYINYISPESVCQGDVKRSTILQTAHFRNKTPFKLPALNRSARESCGGKISVNSAGRRGRKAAILSKLGLIFCLIKSSQHLCAFKVFNKSGKVLFCDRRWEAKERVVQPPPPPPAPSSPTVLGSLRRDKLSRRTDLPQKVSAPSFSFRAGLWFPG